MYRGARRLEPVRPGEGWSVTKWITGWVPLERLQYWMPKTRWRMRLRVIRIPFTKQWALALIRGDGGPDHD